MASMPPAVVSLASLLLVFLLQHVRVVGAACEPVACGNFTIEYPFWLGAPSRLRPEPSCGHPAFELWCINSNTTACMSGSPIHVHSIDYGARSLVVYHNRVASGSDSVCRADFNVSSSLALSPFKISPTNHALCFLSNCSGTEPRGPEYAGVSSCGRPIVAYLGGSYDRDIPPAINAGNCTYNYLPVLGTEAAGSTAANYTRLLKAGFLLDWAGTGGIGDCPTCVGSGGQCRYRNAIGAFACLCPDGKLHGPTCAGGSTRIKMIFIAVGAVLGGGAFFLFIFFVLYQRKRKKQAVASNEFMRSGSSTTSYSKDLELGGSPHIFTFEELEVATDGFSASRELGDGGFGTVYKGKLKDGRVVAVKRLYKNNYRRVEQFLNEVDILSRLLHQNLVILYGCTSRMSRDLLLVYEFIANGTVADHLHGSRSVERGLTWPLRLNIAIETAEALAYLHAVEIIHRDVKTTNILLDNSFHVKVADFGLSRLFPLEVTHVSTVPQGTPGYVDPVYHQCYKLTDKSDVYSFGVVLVELISSKPAVDMNRSHSEINLANMALNRIQNHEVVQLVDPDLGYDTDPETKRTIDRVAEVAFQCLQMEREMRPSIKEVVEILTYVRDGDYQSKSMRKKASQKEDVHLLTDGLQFSPDTVIHRFHSQSTNHSVASNASGL
ncbi:LEAF RUST 10 DISEASE-RESISTANCE LOCUS RECEPTOR-LIKE PROTEIN KINASE-like 1.2 isoform X2 [Hordeum vulgare subsp. vulgare]|uniref:LEAF RUST 10 DISEASE-RESISTANCE LOCUS RECEPTOR-LIKE PROTEIN KINASE-like 1.2 isoform X2 n=1 Tax=Hordeum vulgare subsp. vulgare TaxID=112509 RepID=UPI000B4687A1|nr:LEAF RUST 10 DISEASE-RESISTANCE LOCUS RECEPTOR-LIKE PROTEIN KINASE-like 1.2 isoform X2 [Hordeum vulgare subsp. vulgare]